LCLSSQNVEIVLPRQALKSAVEENKDGIVAAVVADLCQVEWYAGLSEVNLVCNEILRTLDNLSDWMRAEIVPVELACLPGRGEVRHEPLGTVFIIAPWNYPISLCLKPLIGALAAGNTALVKPSEITPACSAALAKIIAKHFDPSVVACIEGGADVAQAALKERFDLVFYTGSTSVGRAVYKAAAEHLTPVVLELGGKSPVFVDETVDLQVAANRICFAKFR
jgi:aldehyde dehydrogenase (NAD+)